MPWGSHAILTLDCSPCEAASDLPGPSDNDRLRAGVHAYVRLSHRARSERPDRPGRGPGRRADKAAGLKEAGARVIGVDPAADHRDPGALEGIELRVEAYRAEHLRGISLAIAAAPPEVNRRVVADARRAGVWSCSTSDPGEGDFRSRGLAIGPAGAHRLDLRRRPALAAALRDRAAEAVLGRPPPAWRRCSPSSARSSSLAWTTPPPAADPRRVGRSPLAGPLHRAGPGRAPPGTPAAARGGRPVILPPGWTTGNAIVAIYTTWRYCRRPVAPASRSCQNFSTGSVSLK